MTSTRLSDLTKLTDSLYQAELQKMYTLNMRETDIRRRLADLEAHRRENQTLPANELHGIRQIGGDVLWQGWVSRTREDLTARLAQVLAQKARAKGQLQLAFGKQMAARKLLSEAAASETRNSQKQFWQTQDDLQAMKSAAAKER